jgi:hypothetical protein
MYEINHTDKERIAERTIHKFVTQHRSINLFINRDDTYIQSRRSHNNYVMVDKWIQLE